VIILPCFFAARRRGKTLKGGCIPAVFPRHLTAKTLR